MTSLQKARKLFIEQCEKNELTQAAARRIANGQETEVEAAAIQAIAEALTKAESVFSDINFPAKEVEAFEDFARDNRLNMAQHPLHYLFLDSNTSMARLGWKAAVEFIQKNPQ